MCRPKFETDTFKMRANLLGSTRVFYQPWMSYESGALVGWHGKGEVKWSEKNQHQCQFIKHISHKNYPRIEPNPPQWEAGD